jgi:hypothetical protein
MTTKELIYAEVERMDDEELRQLYGLIKSFLARRASGSKPSLMESLRRIQIDDAPEDLSTNHDLYLNGEKSVE